MPLSVAATSPDGRFVGVAHGTTEEALSDLMDELQHRGMGYFELQDAAAMCRCSRWALRGTQAVIHLFFEDADSVSLLQGAGASSPPQAVDVPIMGELATFDGAFALSLDTARQVVQDFVRGSLPDALVWRRL